MISVVFGRRECLSHVEAAAVAHADGHETEHIEPLAHPLPIQNVFRMDESAPSLAVDDALANAPDRRGDFYGVPAVLE